VLGHSFVIPKAPLELDPGDPVSERDESAPPPPKAPRKSWTPPRIDDLPRLENLTLQTGSVGDPVDGGSGSIFP
jgi:hypothetical protein